MHQDGPECEKRPIERGPQRHFPASISAKPAAAASLHFAYSRCPRRTTPHTPAQGLIRRRLAMKSHTSNLGQMLTLSAPDDNATNTAGRTPAIGGALCQL